MKVVGRSPLAKGRTFTATPRQVGDRLGLVLEDGTEIGGVAAVLANYDVVAVTSDERQVLADAGYSVTYPQ